MRRSLVKTFKGELGGWKVALVCLALSAGCSKSGGSSQFSSLLQGSDGSSSTCTIVSTTPSASAAKVPASASASTQFTTIANDTSCVVSYTLNGTAISSSSGVALVSSGDLVSGTNILIATAAGTSGSATKTWTVTKNQAPICALQTPSSTGNTLGTGGTLTLNAVGSDADGDAITYKWKVNSNSVSTSLLSIVTGPASSQGTFTPDNTFGGNNTVTADISDGTDTATCSWTIAVNSGCGISSSLPTASTARVASAGATNTIFQVSPTDVSCNTNWKLNGTSVGTGTTSYTLNSASLNAGANTLVATVTDGTSSGTKTWTVNKNSPPSCASQTPSSTGNSVVLGNSINLVANGSDSDSDPLVFSWTVNGLTVPSGVLSVLSSASSAQGTFTPTSAYAGSNTIVTSISDGYDTSTCSWTVAASAGCSITSTTPSSATTRVAAAASTNNAFSVTPSDASCTVTWELNGSALSGSGSNRSILSSTFITGANILKATASNGVTSANTTFTVLKNNPPTCASQTPAATGSSIGSNASLSLTANGGDGDSDALTFNWAINGVAGTATNFTTTSTSSSSTTVFSPAGSFVGNNTITSTISDGYDSTQCTWTATVQPVCAFSSATPTASTLRVSNVGTTSTNFGIAANDASCSVSWSLNGTSLGLSSTLISLLSSQLNAGSNTLVATLSNGAGPVTKTWTVTRNTPPTCSAQSPAATGSNVGIGNNIALAATGYSADTLPLTFSWTANGTAVSTPVFTIVNSGSVSTATFAPDASFTGSPHIVSNITDGYDSTSCSWTIGVLPICSVSSASPSGSTLRVSSIGSTSSPFVAIPNDSSCAVTWALNSVAYGSAGNIQNLLSSDLNSGANTLTATLTNSIGTTTRSWTVTKNTPPSCSSQTPASSGNTVNTNGTIAFTANATSFTTVTFNWLLDSSSSALFTPITTTGNTSVATLNPNISTVGTGHTITAGFNDGYDSGTCSWALDVQDPNTVAISSCSPVNGSTVVVNSSGSGSTQNFSVSATGTGLTYSWLENGSATGVTASSSSFNAAGLAVGTYTIKAVATDSYSNSANCTWTVKRNAPPVISASTPSSASAFKLNLGSSQAFNVTTTQGDADTLTYTWTLDGATNAALSSGTAISTLNPASNLTYLGSHTVQATVSDGYETATQQWTVEINSFSNACNTLYNGAVADTGGKVCTLAGIPGTGSGLVATDDQTQIRILPSYVIQDGANLIFSDQVNDAVYYYNRTGSPVTKFNITIPAGAMEPIIGNGSDGVNADGQINTAFKLNTPFGLALDSVNNILYIGDTTNDRVVALNSSGVASTVFGITGSAGNNLAGNTDGAAGTSQGCSTPYGIDFVSYGGQKWLYVACYGNNAIKKMAADPTDAANYGKGYLVVGTLSATNTTTSASIDGALGATGGAYTTGPMDIEDDGAGNIYWVEWGGYRVRMAATGGSDVIASAGATSTANTITATDLSATPLTAGTIVTTAVAGNAGTSSLGVIGPKAARTGSCVPYRVMNLDSAIGSPTDSPLAITLSGAGSGGAFYTNSTCTSSTTSLTIATGDSEADFYFAASATGARTFTATSGSGSGTLAMTVAAAGTASKLAVFTDSSQYYAACTRVTVQVETSAGTAAALAGSNRTIRLSTNGGGTFFASSTCSGTPSTTYTIASTDSELPVYYSRTAVAAANQTISILGNTGTAGWTAGNSATVPSAGAATLQPRSISLVKSAGNVVGIFASLYSQSRVAYFNNTATSVTIGGVTVSPYSIDSIWGTGTSSYNGDGVLGSTSMIYNPEGTTVDSSGNFLYLADLNNSRIRTLDLTINNGLAQTVLGAGRQRAGFISDSQAQATQMYFNSPTKMTMDNTNRLMYISDAGNSRIRQLNMLTGLVDTYVGKGAGNATVENDDPANVYLRSPRGLSLLSSGSSTFLLYADQSNGSTAINYNCQVRAYNTSSISGSIFGITIPGQKVATIAGNYSKGCEGWNYLGNDYDGMNATTGNIYNPEGIATDGTNLYIADYNDHCILKVDGSGNMTRLIGVCGTAPNPALDGTTTVATTRYPEGITMDPSYAGNFFFVDSIDLSPSKVRYVNFLNQTLSIAGVTINPANPTPTVTTLFTESGYGGSNGRLNDVAAFDKQICYGGGVYNDGSNGTHNVECVDRTNSFGQITIRIGPNETSVPTRAGAPFAQEQEGVGASSATIASPWGLTFDSSGNLYISERYNHMIRMVRRWW